MSGKLRLPVGTHLRNRALRLPRTAYPAAFGRALSSSAAALLDRIVSPDALTPRRDAALASHKAKA